MYTLRQWFHIKAKQPIQILVGVAMLIQLGFLAITYVQNRAFQKQIFEEFSEVVNMALVQGNRPLIETIFQIAVHQFKATSKGRLNLRKLWKLVSMRFTSVPDLIPTL